MYEDLILPDDVAIRNALISSLYFPHQFKIIVKGDVGDTRRLPDITDSNEETQKRMRKTTFRDLLKYATPVIQDEILFRVLECISYTEAYHFTTNVFSPRLNKIFIRHVNHLIENHTKFQPIKNFSQDITLLSFEKNPFICFDTKTFTNNVKGLGKSLRVIYKQFIVLLSMLNNGIVDQFYINDKAKNDISTNDKKIFTQMDLWIKTDLPETNKLDTELVDVIQAYMATNTNEYYAPMYIAIGDFQYQLTLRPNLNFKIQSKLYKGLYSFGKTRGEASRIQGKSIFLPILDNVQFKNFRILCYYYWEKADLENELRQYIRRHQINEEYEQSQTLIETDFAENFNTNRIPNNFYAFGTTYVNCLKLFIKQYNLQNNSIHPLFIYSTFRDIVHYICQWKDETLQLEAIKELFKLKIEEKKKNQYIIYELTDLENDSDRSKLGKLFNLDVDFLEKLSENLNTPVTII